MMPPPNTQLLLTQTGAAKRPGRWHYALLAAVMILAGVLRLGGITRVGIRYDDEACYATDARLWHRCASVLIDPQAVAALWHGDKKAFQQSLDEHGVDFTTRFHPKQGFTFLAALMMFVVGDRPAGLLATNALLGTFSVLLLYGIAVVLFSRPVALCAAFFMAVSGYHIVYSRSAYTDTTTGFFILLGVFMWVLGALARLESPTNLRTVRHGTRICTGLPLSKPLRSRRHHPDRHNRGIHAPRRDRPDDPRLARPAGSMGLAGDWRRRAALGH